MATQITGVTRNTAGTTTHVCGAGLGKTAVVSVIQAIQLGQEFFVDVGGRRVGVVVVGKGPGAYLRTDPDYTMQNNLDFLGPC